MSKTNKPIVIWLLTGCFLIAAMVIIGGITRLTQSGLSMVEWKLIMGTVPPMSEAEWIDTFNKYKEFPEYKIVNTSFTLAQFKSIFWWEYIHRMLGRLIGIVFVIPFTVFLLQKRVKRELLKKLIVLFIIGGFQGFLGWYMVKSGLVKDPHVSHFRLAAHLIAAFSAFGYSLWIALDLTFGKSNPLQLSYRLKKLVLFVFGLLLLQIIYGAFVAGLKAGLYYNTWPLMGGTFVPEEIWNALSRDGISSLVNNITTVQFLHRTLGIIIGILALCIFFEAKRTYIKDTGPFNLIALTVLIQIILGIYTLLYKVPVVLGVVHQFGALVLFASFLYLIHRTMQVTPMD